MQLDPSLVRKAKSLKWEVSDGPLESALGQVLLGELQAAVNCLLVATQPSFRVLNQDANFILGLFLCCVLHS